MSLQSALTKYEQHFLNILLHQEICTRTHLSDATVIYYRISRYDVKTAQYQRGRVGRKLDISRNIFSVEIKNFVIAW